MLEALRYEPLALRGAGPPVLRAEAGPWPLLVQGRDGRLAGPSAPEASLDAYGDRGAGLRRRDRPRPRCSRRQPRPFEFVPLPKFPAVVRDLSFLRRTGTSPSQDIRQAVAKLDVALPRGLRAHRPLTPGRPSPRTRSACPSASSTATPRGRSSAEDVDKSEQKIVRPSRPPWTSSSGKEEHIDNRARAN